MRTRSNPRRHSDSGASAVEYGLLIAAVGAALVAVVFGVGRLTAGNFAVGCWTSSGGASCAAGSSASPSPSASAVAAAPTASATPSPTSSARSSKDDGKDDGKGSSSSAAPCNSSGNGSGKGCNPPSTTCAAASMGRRKNGDG